MKKLKNAMLTAENPTFNHLIIEEVAQTTDQNGPVKLVTSSDRSKIKSQVEKENQISDLNKTTKSEKPT